MSSDSPSPINRNRSRLRYAVVLILAVWGGYESFVLLARYRATIALNAYDPERALIWLDRLSTISSPTVEDRLLRLRTYRKLGEIDSFKTLAATLEADGLAEAVRTQKILFQAQGGRVAEVGPRLPMLLQDPGNDGADICEAFTNGYVGNYQIEKAIPVLDAWLADYPNDPQALVIRGRIEEHKGNWDGALSSYEASLESDPDFGPAAYNAARIMLNRKRPEDAIRFYQIVSDWLIEDAPARVGQAHCYRMLEDPDRARKELEGLLNSNQNPKLRERSFRLLGEMAGSAETSVYGELGQIELAAGNFEAALRWLKQAVDITPQDQTLRYLLARALVGANRKGEAQEHFDYYRKANDATKRLDELMGQIRANPSDADLRSEIGEIFLNYLSENQGVMWLNSALAIDESHQEANRTLADYYARSKTGDADGNNIRLEAVHRSRLNPQSTQDVDD